MEDHVTKLVEDNLRLVNWTITRWYRPLTYDDDAIQAGNLGLIRAAEKFDPELGYTFSTYAVQWIRGFVQRHVNGPRREDGTLPLKRQGTVVSLNTLVSSEDGTELGDFYPDESIDLHRDAERAELKRVIAEVIDSLDERDRVIVRELRRGGNLGSAADKLGVSRQHLDQNVYPNLARRLRAALADFDPSLDGAA